nr:hypothetical protein 4 [Spirochaetaceae bacterium]
MAETIEIKCTGTTSLPLSELREFQGGIKTIMPAALEALKTSIITHGFSAPIFIWQHSHSYHVIDGHQRMKALTALEADGYIIPDLPIAFIEAASEAEARAKLLHIASQYGDFNLDALFEFIGEAEIENAGGLRLVNEELLLDARFFDPGETGSLDDYNAPQETVLVCPHCQHQAPVADYERRKV